MMEFDELCHKLSIINSSYSNTLRDLCIQYCEINAVSDLANEIDISNIQLQGFIKGLLDIDKLEFSAVLKLFIKFNMIEQFGNDLIIYFNNSINSEEENGEA